MTHMCLGALAATDGYMRPTALPKDGPNGENITVIVSGFAQNIEKKNIGKPPFVFY